jgi:hypothetical protein
MRRFSQGLILLIVLGGATAQAQTAQQVMQFVYRACLANMHGTPQQCTCWTEVALGRLTPEDDEALMQGRETQNTLQAERMATAQCFGR